jgi:hypothetical protein
VKIVASVAAVATLAPVGVSTLERRHRDVVAAQEQTRTTTAERRAPAAKPAPAVTTLAPAATPSPAPVAAPIAAVEESEKEAAADKPARRHAKPERDWAERSLRRDHDGGTRRWEPATARRLAPTIPHAAPKRDWTPRTWTRDRTRTAPASAQSDHAHEQHPGEQPEDTDEATTTAQQAPVTTTQPAPAPAGTTPTQPAQPPVDTTPQATPPPEEHVPAE